MASGNQVQATHEPAESTSGNTARGGEREPRAAMLSVEATAAMARYQRALAAAPLSAASRAKYVARVRRFLAWLETAGRDPELDGDRYLSRSFGQVLRWISWSGRASPPSRWVG